MADEQDPTDLQAIHEANGVPPFAAEALADLEIGPEALKYIDSRDLFQKVLEWQGIIGYTGEILATIKWLKSQKDWEYPYD